MKFFVKLLIFVVVLLAAGAAASRPVLEMWRERTRVRFREAEVTRGTITAVVNSTGEVKPVLSVSVGSFVSGPITDLHVDFNDRVSKDQLLAEIDPRIYVAAVERDRAALVTREADVERVRALLQQAMNDEKRALALRSENEDYISPTEVDKYHFTRRSLDAQLKVAIAAVDQAKATLENSEANLGYTKITSPVEGIIIDRKIDSGQTLAAQFETPELFVIAPAMDKKMHVFASVDEADIGLIRQSQEEKRPVHFTVDAYPDSLFVGEIEQIRFSSETTENVVTYPVVVAATNADLKLLPGMTANLSFQIEERENVICIPNSALRFFPDAAHVRAEDKPLIDGTSERTPVAEDSLSSAKQKAQASQEMRRRHVWVQDGRKLRAVPVTIGINDNKYTELTSGELEPGMKLVTNVQK